MAAPKAPRFICLLVGHRWQEDQDEHESYGILRCARCGKHYSLAGRDIDPSRVAGARTRYPVESDEEP